MSHATPDPRNEPEPLLPHNWHELAPLVDALLDAPPERRAALRDELSAGDANRRAELEHLVAECEREAPLLDAQAAERFDVLLGETPDVPLPDVLGGRYRIERELGRGGMARVYLARDIKHARNVAVKVIRPELAASLGRERFLREIRIAAQLHHPNIVALYDSGDADGVLYFVMPYEEGPSLRARLSDGTTLSVAEAVSTLRDLARALAYAHEHGIVHRDVKPDNVMLSGGMAVVTDFGIAKAVSVAQGDTALHTLTQAGAGIGTAAYMAPEQAVGDPGTDHRADIYSFGCLAYELFTGKPPFHDLPTHLIIAAHVGTEPVPITDVRADVPVAVAQLVARCLEKNPVARPQSAQELLSELERVSTVSHTVVRRRMSRARVVAFSTIGVMLVGIGGFSGYSFYRNAKTPVAPMPGELTLAVLPLRSLGGDSLHVDMADGFSDEIATSLRKTPGVHVMSRPTVGRYSGQRDIDPQKTGRDLGARFLVMGSLRWNGDELSVNVKLVESQDLNVLWAEVIDRHDGDFSSARDSIVRAIEQTLRTRFGASARALVNAQTIVGVTNAEAYRMYLLAQGKLNKRGQNVRASADLFRSAATLDTNYAKAWSGLSLALALTPYFHPVSTRQVAAEATSAALRAQSLDSTLAQPHVALGLVYEHDYKWADAETEFQAALRLRSSDDVESLVQYGRYLLFRGRNADGLAQFLTARESDPASALVSSWVSYAYYLGGRLDSALAESNRAYQSDSTNMTTLSLGAGIRVKSGRKKEALDLVSRIKVLHPLVLYVLAAAGDTLTAMARLRSIESKQPRPWLAATARAFTMLGAGDTTQAMAALELATDLNENWPTMEPISDPMYDSIRASARFQRLLRRVGLVAGESSPTDRPRSR